MSAADEREWIIECRPALMVTGEKVNPFDDWLTWPVEKDQESVQNEEGRIEWINTRMAFYGTPDVITPFVVGWTGLTAFDMRIRKNISRRIK